MGRAMKESGVEWIGQAPDSWKCYMLSQIATQVKNENTGMVENNLLSLSYGKIKKRSITAVGGLLPKSFEGYNIIEPDDIVLRLTDLQNDHTSLRVGISTQRGIVTSAYLTIRLTSANYPKYVYYYLHTFDICKGLYGMGAGVRQGLNWQGMKKLSILLPNFNEQRQIVKYLDEKCTEIDELIENVRTTIEEYNHLKQAVITHAVTKGVRGERAMKESGIEILGMIPSDWQVRKLVHISEKIGDGLHGTPQFSSDGKFSFINGNNLGSVHIKIKDTTNRVSETEANKYLVSLNQQSLLISLNGTIGNLSYYNGENLILGKSAGYITLMPEINKDFIYYYLQSSIVSLIFELSLVGTTIKNLSLETMRNLRIIYPPVDEQQQIVDYLAEKCVEIDALIAKEEQLMAELENYKKSLIYEYVTGKKEVPNYG